jgi:hypothetical protein
VATLFQPARRRYNAAKTVEAFSVRLRNEVDLDTLTGELLAVVNQTVEPTAVSLMAAVAGPSDRAVEPGPGAA